MAAHSDADVDDADDEAWFQAWTNGQQQWALVQCRQARLRACHVFYRFVDRLRTASTPHGEPWSTAPRDAITHATVRARVAQLLDACQAVGAEVTEALVAAVPTTTPTTAAQPPPVRLPAKQGARSAPMPVPPRRRLPARVTSHAYESHVPGHAEGTSPPAGTTVYDRLAAALVDTVQQIFLRRAMPLGPEDSGHVVLWFQDLVLNDLQRLCTQCAAADTGVDRLRFADRAPLRRDELEQLRQDFWARAPDVSDALADQYPVEHLTRHLLYNVPGAPARVVAAPDVIVRPINQRIANDHGLETQALATPHPSGVAALVDAIGFRAVGDRARNVPLADVMRTLGVQASVLTAAALGHLPWVVHVPYAPGTAAIELGPLPAVSQPGGGGDTSAHLTRPTDAASKAQAAREAHETRRAYLTVLAPAVREARERGVPLREVRTAPAPPPSASPPARSRLAPRVAVVLGPAMVASAPVPRAVGGEEEGAVDARILHPLRRLLARTSREWLARSPMLRDEVVPDLLAQTDLDEDPEAVVTGVLGLHAGLALTEALVTAPRPLPAPPATVEALDATALREMVTTLLFAEALGTLVYALAGPGGTSLGMLRDTRDPADATRMQQLADAYVQEQWAEACPPWLRRVQVDVANVLRAGQYGAVDVPVWFGTFHQWSAVYQCALRLDAVQLAARATLYGHVLKDYLWQWRHAGRLPRAEAHWTSKVWHSVTAFLQQGRGTSVEADEARQRRLDAVNDTAGLTRAAGLYWTGFCEGVIDALGLLCVGAAGYASLLGVSGVPYDWPMAHTFVVQAALRGTVPGDTALALLRVGERLTTGHNVLGLPRLHADEAVGASLVLYTWLQQHTAAERAALRALFTGTDGGDDDVVLAQWVDSVETVRAQMDKGGGDAAPLPEMDEPTGVALLEQVPLHLMHNGWFLLYALRRRVLIAHPEWLAPMT